MNWFERHLNWTGLITYFTTIILWIILVQINLGGYSFSEYFRYYMRPQYGLFLFIALLVVSYGLLFFNFLIFLWILKQKGQSSKFLMSIFLVAIFFLLGFLLPQGEFDSIPKFWTLFSLATLTISWIILISLYNWSKRKKGIPVSNPNSVIVPGHCRFFISKYLTRLIFTFIITTVILVSVSSGIYLRFGESTFEYNTSSNIKVIPHFSFSYPVSFYKEYLEGDVVLFSSVDYDITFKQAEGWLQKSRSILGLYISSYHEYPKIRDYSLDEMINRFLDSASEPNSSFFKQQTLNEMTISEKNLKYFVITYEKNLEDINNQSEISLYFFKAHDELWVFQLWNFGQIPTQPPAYFTHLLESFKIYNQ